MLLELEDYRRAKRTVVNVCPGDYAVTRQEDAEVTEEGFWALQWKKGHFFAYASLCNPFLSHVVSLISLGT